MEYRDAEQLFQARLKMKHLLKGVQHRSMSVDDLLIILKKEVRELDVEVFNSNRIKMIEESCDVMICGLIIIDRILNPEGEMQK